MPVPEAPVDKHHGPVLGQHDVRGAWQVLDVHTVPESPPPERTPEGTSGFVFTERMCDINSDLSSFDSLSAMVLGVCKYKVKKSFRQFSSKEFTTLQRG